VKFFLSLIFLFSTFAIFSNGWCATDSRAYCFKDLQVNFFNENVVYQALSLYRIPQGLWAPISQNLKIRSNQVPERMRKITAAMVPNPLNYPMQNEIASKLLKQVLLDVFYETMTKYQVNERPTADFVFDYIFTQQLPKMINCFGEDARKLAPSFE